ncbi:MULTISPECIES: amino acid permease [Vitreoscilla]|uniref:Amino acid permease n=1 Tax=Vitreoscilla stercoraria TaxID=61 RepID=A0ABY4E7T1_VITST|nr:MULTISPECIES: amino acid permease [Vitreoscilla]AUZ04464.1 amino acid permease [Vitreoscilla sp. C1]UOO91824.1 amino acid permease [Vitreoscilla stercoraria]
MSQFDKIQAREAGLHKKLTARQMSMIAIGGAIGTGLFLGSKFAISFAGPAVIVSYAIGGVIALLLMACLAEMTIAHPTSGSFGAYAEHYISPLAGFLVRYSYWSCIVLAVGTEVTAVAEYMKMWFPDVASWWWIVGFSAALIGVNAYSVKAFGSVEYWFSSVKVFAILAFILLAVIVLFGQHGISDGMKNLTAHEGFAPNGFWGIWVGVIISIFSYLSIEMIAVAAGEAENPEESVRKAFRATVYRLVIFYLLSLSLIVMLVPWTALVAKGASSPFITVMQELGIPFADGILNFIVIIAALSAMNSMLYISTRMMFSLSRAGDAPKMFGKIKANGVPMNALILSASGIAVASIVYGINPEAAFPVMISLSMFGAMLTWGMIFVTHFFFRRQIEKEGRVLSFRVPGFPVGTILGAVLMLAIMLTTYMTDVFKSTLLFGLPFTIALVGLYYVLRRKPQAPETLTQAEQEQV